MMNHSKGLLYAASTALLWGFLAIALKVAVTELSPVTVVWFRFGSAFLILAVITAIIRPSDFLIFRSPPKRLFLTAFFLGFNYLGFISGIKYVSPSVSQVFIMTGPVTFALSGIVIFREEINWRHLLGFFLVVTGIFIFYSEQLSEIRHLNRQFTKGMLLIFGGGFSWAIFASLQKTLVQKYSTNQLNLFIYSFCALLFLPFIEFDKITSQSPDAYLLLLFLGINTVLAYGSLALAIKMTEANRVSVIITLNPIITFVTMAILTRMNVAWLDHEHFSMVSIFGALVLLTGAILVILAGRRKRHSPMLRKP